MASTKSRKPSAAIRSTSDLAKRLGLSRWTISGVLNGRGGISPETELRVKEAMSELGFAPNSLARGLRKGTTNIIGVCIPEIEGFHLARKLEFLRQSLTAEGFHVMMGITNGKPQEEAETLERFRTLQTAGVISFASQLGTNAVSVQQFQQTGIPLIFVDPMVKPPKGSLCVDRSIGMRDAVRHLLAFGHRHITTLGLTAESPYSRSRLKGVAAAYEERGWKREEFVQQIALPQADSPYEAGRESAALVWPQRACKARRPTAVLALNDRVAIGLIDGLRGLGVQVPEDLSVIGYDNMEVGAFVSPGLTSIDAQPDALVKQATELLLQRIRGSQESKPSRIATRLHVRASTAPVRCG